MTAELILYLSVIAALVLANAFFVAAEFALVRVRKTRIQEMVDAGNATAKVVRDAIDNLDYYISATQVGITLASLGLGATGEPVLAKMIFEPLLGRILPADLVQAWVHPVSFGFAFFIITFLHVAMGELLPKSIALQYPEKMSLWVARPMKLCAFLFRPLIWVLNGSSNQMMRMMGIKPVDAHSLALSEEELLMVLSESKKAGVVSENEQRMVQRVFKFYDKTVREIMIPRPDIIALDLRADEHQIKEAFKQGYSRLPVYDGTLNNVKGIVYVKDLIYTLQDPKLIKLIDLLRETLYVPESKPVPQLLEEFQRSKVHLAIVVDEFGDTAGLVSLEDVIEEIVGEIQDEYDYEPAQVERGKDGITTFDGKTPIERFVELNPAFELPDGSFDTVAGLIFQLSGRVPRETEVIKSGEYCFRVVKRDGRRLRKIAVWKEETPPPPSTAGAPKEPAKRTTVAARDDE